MLETVSTVLICIGGVIGIALKIIREKKTEELIDKAVAKRLEKNN